MTTIAELREQVRGPIVEPGEDGYDELRRVHNGMPAGLRAGRPADGRHDAHTSTRVLGQ